MLNQVVDAFDRRDYPVAAQLLRELVKQSPNDPWVKLYLGRLQEVSGKANAAEEIYKQLLRYSNNTKLMSQARLGLQRLQTLEQERRQQAIAQATADPDAQQLGVLILEPIPSDRRIELAQRFAKITHTDAYTARGVMPHRGWRLYRTGAIGELQVLGQDLQQAGIPNFAAALPKLQAIPVFQVDYIQALQPQVTVVCHNESQEQGVLTFAWSEVQQRVDGLLPLFSQVCDRGYRDKTEWKEEITDYVHFHDLHLPQRRCILRLNDDRYDLAHGITAQQHHDTRRQGWDTIIQALAAQTPAPPCLNEFTIFAENTSDFAELLLRMPNHVLLPRASDCYVDSAFHLYSSLAFAKQFPRR